MIAEGNNNSTQRINIQDESERYWSDARRMINVRNGKRGGRVVSTLGLFIIPMDVTGSEPGGGLLRSVEGNYKRSKMYKAKTSIRPQRVRSYKHFLRKFTLRNFYAM